MKSIYEYYQMLNESFQSKYVRMFAQDASLYVSNFKNFCDIVGLYYLAWDKIDNSDITKIEISDDKTDILKMFRALKAGKENYWSTNLGTRVSFVSKRCVLFGYKDDKLHCTYDNWGGHFYYVERDKLYKTDKTRVMEDCLAECDVVYLVLVDKHDTRKLIGDRGGARAGMVPNLDQKDREAQRHTGILGQDAGGVNKWEGGEFTRYCARLAEEAKDRWKKIIAENKFKRSSDTKEIDDLVEKTVNTYFSFMQEVMKASVTNKKISKYRLSSVTDLVTGKAKSSKYNDYGWLEGGLLNVYRQYCEANVELAQGGSYVASALESRDRAATYLKRISADILALIDKLKKEWEM